MNLEQAKKYVREGNEVYRNNTCTQGEKVFLKYNKSIEKCEVVCSNCHRIRTYNRIYACKPDVFEKSL